jgi:hypothetical protein
LIAPLGIEVTEQLGPETSPAAKLLPEIVTFCPTRAGFDGEPGVKVIFGFAVKLALALSPVFPFTVML